jgi:hypothetical protein
MQLLNCYGFLMHLNAFSITHKKMNYEVVSSNQFEFGSFFGAKLFNK